MTGALAALFGGREISVSIVPDDQSDFAVNTASHDFSATASAAGGPATAYQWGVLSETDGTGAIVGAGTSAAGTLRVIPSAQEIEAVIQFYCDITVGGVVRRATCICRYTDISGA